MNDDLIDDFFLESFPNPERKGCPDDATLQAFAEDRLPPGNPVLSHVSSCSECYREYRHYREDWREAEGEASTVAPWAKSMPIPIAPSKLKTPAARSFRGWTIAAGLAVVLGTGLYFAHEHQASPAPGALVASNINPVSVDVDLFDAVTTRGGGDDAALLKEVSLPSSLVNLSVTLPRFSQSGPYQVLVARDRGGRDVVARGTGQAVEADKKVRLTVSLDLRKTAPGTYFLATVRGSDNGTYYYPLKVS